MALAKASRPSCESTWEHMCFVPRFLLGLINVSSVSRINPRSPIQFMPSASTHQPLSSRTWQLAEIKTRTFSAAGWLHTMGTGCTSRIFKPLLGFRMPFASNGAIQAWTWKWHLPKRHARWAQDARAGFSNHCWVFACLSQVTERSRPGLGNGTCQSVTAIM